MTLSEKIRKTRIALIGPDAWIRGSLSLLFECESCLPADFDNFADCMRARQTDRFDIIICDYAMGEERGISMPREGGRVQPGAVRILTAGYPFGEITDVAAREEFDGSLQEPFPLQALETTLGEPSHDESRDFRCRWERTRNE